MSSMKIFNLFSKNKEYVSCNWLEYGIHFTSSGLDHCDKYAHPGGTPFSISQLDDNHQYNFADFFKKKRKARKQAKKGILPSGCNGCYLLKKKEWEPSDKIKCMAISPHTKCNSNCIYCYTSFNKRAYNSKKDIPIFNILKKLVEKEIISKDCEIAFNNGEPLIMDEFEDIVNLFVDNKIGRLRIHSSGISYSKSVERALTSGCCDIVISPDSGNSELYKKIKRVDKFDNVWTNIRKYALVQTDKSTVQVKYIIIPMVNDNEDNIKEFVDKAKSSGIQRILIDIEIWWYRKNAANEQKIQRIFELIKYAKQYISQSGLIFCSSITFDTAIATHKVLYDKVFGNVIH